LILVTQMNEFENCTDFIHDSAVRELALFIIFVILWDARRLKSWRGARCERDITITRREGPNMIDNRGPSVYGCLNDVVNGTEDVTSRQCFQQSGILHEIVAGCVWMI
jgi:hypothetical protein